MALSSIADALKMAYSPVAILHTNEKPEGAVQFKEGRWGCVIAMLTAAAKGRTACFDRSTTGCGGGMVGLGFGRQSYDQIPGGIEYFLSTGRGEGFREGEGYRKTPELAKSFIDALPVLDIPFTYVVFKPLTAVDPEQETPVSIVFYANPDQLSALVVLAAYGRPAGESVIMPQGAGCHSIGIHAYREGEHEVPRAVLGLMDVSARPYVDANVVSFTVPWKMYLEMEGNVQGSFLQKEAWAKVCERL